MNILLYKDFYETNVHYWEQILKTDANTVELLKFDIILILFKFLSSLVLFKYFNSHVKSK